jgi:hypothetical protein
MGLEALQKQMSEALAANDVKKIEEVAMAIVKSKSERAKEEADKALKESEALAGKRETLASAIKQSVLSLGLDKSIAELKAKGFTYTIDHKEDDKGRIDPKGEVSVTGGVGLIVPAIKARKAGGTGGGAGKTKDEFGMSLTEVFEKFATADDRTKLAAAETNSSQWQVKNAVKKRALKDGVLAPAK